MSHLRDELDEVFVSSCGCVFCDLGIEPNGTRDGRPVHVHHATLANNFRPYTICALPIPEKDDGR